MKGRLPAWFKQKPPDPQLMTIMDNLLEGLGLHTICQSARCPNIGGCFARGTATFLILGDVCTRNCTFCAVNKGVPTPVDKTEPQRLLEAVERLNLSHAVVTSVTRDDLADGGGAHFAEVINQLHQSRNITVEVLIPDFLGSNQALERVVEARPEVLNHNVETVPRLYPQVRPGAAYNRSIRLLEAVKRIDPGIVTKSGLMLGLGETREEVIDVLGDLRRAGVGLLTIGQYLQPSPEHHPIASFIPPDDFAQYEKLGREMGFAGVASAPLVRSSFKAAELYRTVRKN
jgi:lipoic acid synthetase